MQWSHFPPRVDGSIGEFDGAEPGSLQSDHPCVSHRAAKFMDYAKVKTLVCLQVMCSCTNLVL